MPFGSVRLIPGVNVEKTPTLNEAGYSTTSLIRYRDGLAQKLGGWSTYYSSALGGVPRDLHAWQDLNQTSWLSIGTTTQFSVLSNGLLQNITPQTLTSDFLPDFSTTMGSPLVTVADPNIATLSVYDSVFFNTPIAVGGLILSGLYPVDVVLSPGSYQINAGHNATSSVASGGAVPVFSTTDTSASVSVALAANGMSVGNVIVFPIPTTGNGVTIDAAYQATSITDANNFVITVSAQANATSSFSMNSGNAELVYYISAGPPPAGIGYGLGGYGDGGYGTGVVPTAQTGTPITATDYTSDNWGEIILACPADGGIYYWAPQSGFTTATLVSSAPVFNSGVFVSTSQQILVAYGSSFTEQIGVRQDPLLVSWSDVSNFFEWTASSATQAGNFHIPIGSEIRGGMAVSNQNLIWTDLDLWVMNYIGYPETYGFNKIGSGAGLAGRHAVMQLRGDVYWMGASNFYKYGNGGVQVLPCPVWDAVFQNLNTAYLQNVRAMPNTGFNEAGWFYPSAASTNGECDSYVKMNITEPGAPWDYGSLARSAWIDQSVLGTPIATAPTGIIYQHETSNDAAGQPMTSLFATGYFILAEGEDYPYVDQILPDMKWGTYAGAQTAQLIFTFNVVNYPGDTPLVYGPYTVTQATQYISTRFRGRQMSITVQSQDLGSFWRLGRIRYRWAPAGRR